MKRLISLALVSTVMFISNVSAQTQTLKISEPDSAFVYHIVTGDSTFDVLPLELGKVVAHRNKVSKISRLVKKAAGVATAGAFVGGMAGGGAGAVTKSLNVMGAADRISTASDVANGLAGIEGQDIAFKGKNSPYKVKTKKGDLRIVTMAPEEGTSPTELFRVVRFFELDGDRRVQWGMYNSSLLGGEDALKHGYLGFTVEKYGEKSCVLVIPRKQLKSGEYGVFVCDVSSSMVFPVGTFSIK